MRKCENECVGCPTEIGCLGDMCPYSNVMRYYCDMCGGEGNIYRINNEDFCENCAREYIQDLFEELSITERAELLEVDICEIDN